VEVAVMSLSAREQQALDSIGDRLAVSDPSLASLLATFTRLVSSEEMPAREKIRAPGRWATWRHRQDRADQPARTFRQGWQRVMLVLGLVVAVTLAAVSLVANRGSGRGTCRTSSVAVCARRAPGPASRPTAHGTPVGPVLPDPW
jgi:hypothetical protein